MAWIYKGRKYWYHNGKRYSRKITSSNSDYSFSYSSFDKKTTKKREWSKKDKRKWDNFFNKYSESDLNDMGFFSSEESYKMYKSK